MTEGSALLVPAVSTALVAIAVSSVLLACFYPLFRRVLAANDPATRSFSTLCYGLMAPATGILVAVLSLRPDITHFLVPDHCHGGACGSHVPAVDPFSLGGIGLAAAGSALLFLMIIVVGRMVLAGQRRLAALFALARHDRHRGYHLLETDAVVAWCCGLLRPRIVVSRGLVSRLGRAQFEVVLAHEAAHAARRDNLRALLLRWATALWPVSRQRVRRDLHEDGERACDAAALALTGDRSVFAETLETLARELEPAGRAGAVAFGRENASARLDALAVDGPGAVSAARAWLALGASWLTQLLLVTVLSHFFVEWLGL